MPGPFGEKIPVYQAGGSCRLLPDAMQTHKRARRMSGIRKLYHHATGIHDGQSRGGDYGLAKSLTEGCQVVRTGMLVADAMTESQWLTFSGLPGSMFASTSRAPSRPVLERPRGW